MDELLEDFEVVVQVTGREDGGIRIRSRQFPGILIGGSDPSRIWGVIGDVVAHAARHDRGLDVRRVVGPMTTPTVRGDITLLVQHVPVRAREAA